MYQPRTGDHVTVTRTHRDGRTTTWTGRVGSVSPAGFHLTGVGPCGSYDGYLSSSAELARYGVSQTVRLHA
jgi:hypothetical protein